MRLVTFAAAGAPRVGAFVDNDRRIVDFAAAAGGGSDAAFTSMQALIEGGAPALDRARAIMADAQRSGRGIVETATVKLLAPLPAPPQMRDFLCFEKHLIQAFARLRQVRAATMPDPEKALREMEAAGTYNVPKIWYERPSFYKPSRFAVCGTDQEVTWPAYSKTIDYELEFACVIGKAGRNITKDQAREYILGQFKGKDFDNSNPIGPCIVTADEIPDPYALEMVVRVNGEERGRGNSREMGWKYEDCIAFVTRDETIHPGELFCSGTVGNGSGLEIGRYLEPGEVVELEVEKIGVLRNRIVRG
jgi:2-keto-4-pentenoate hydratase/2-oxohepta-3-ene-1,7-dioic acid hydratase in catechol pathway